MQYFGDNMHKTLVFLHFMQKTRVKTYNYHRLSLSLPSAFTLYIPHSQHHATQRTDSATQQQHPKNPFA